MASRRVRIKGIANVPQRKKPTNAPHNDESNQLEVKENQAVTTNSIPSEAVTTKQLITSTAKEDEIKNETPTKEESNSEPVKDDDSNKKETKDEIKKPPLRRRFIKPTISNTAISRVKNKPAEVVKECQKELSKETGGDQLIDNANTNVEVVEKSVSTPSSNIVDTVEKTVCRPLDNPDREELSDEVKKEQGGNINLNEIILPACKVNNNVNEESKIKVLEVVKLPKVQYIDGTKLNSDVEYPPPAVSPNKFANRPRIKAVPRLGQRRTSFSIGSASESEDDTRKTVNRNRNDSVSSVVSGNGDLSTGEIGYKKEYSSVILRKCRRTEQSRKLAEARRDFQLKFGNNKPDRQRLTMIDLIFYNPATAPMSQKKKRNDTATTETDSVKDPDDPPCTEDKDTTKEASDDENTVPAPQIVIGANGEIVIDEKSLVIENKATIKGREALKQSQIVNGDFDTGYGIYKRVKRSKDWTKEETLRFYKALNTIGTDFTMMCELFPGRNRRELKLKFKKEERMNKTLVDRAVMQPVQFDMTELRRELEVAEIEKKEAERLKLEKEKLILERANNKRKHRKSSLGGYIQTVDPVEPKVRKPARKKMKKLGSRQEVIKNGINSIIDSDSDSSISTTQSIRTGTGESDSENEAEEQINKKIQTTRSGRISKPSKQTTDIPEAKKLDEPNGNNLESDKGEDLTPGSLMILTDVGEGGETIYKIYTVDENGEKVPIDLSLDILENLTKNVPDLNNSTSPLETMEEFSEEQNVNMDLPSETTIANLTVSDLPSFSDLNESDLIIDEDTIIMELSDASCL